MQQTKLVTPPIRYISVDEIVYDVKRIQVCVCVCVCADALARVGRASYDESKTTRVVVPLSLFPCFTSANV
jgi:hypothetical protein